MKHHFIPKFLLKRWVKASGQLVEYRRVHGKIVSKFVGPDATGFVRNLYTFSDLPIDSSQAVEDKFFKYADQKASDALSLLVGVRFVNWNSEIRSAWSRFLVGLHLRHPDTMPELRAAARLYWDASESEAQRSYERIRDSRDPETFNEWLSARDPHTHTKAQLNLLTSMFDNSNVGNHINNMQWEVIDLAPASNTLLLSDRPVRLFRIGAVDGTISLPITPRKLFVGANNKDILQSIRIKNPDSLVKLVNQESVEKARRYVWADDLRQTRFVENRMSTKLEKSPFFPSLSNTPSLKFNSNIK